MTDFSPKSSKYARSVRVCGGIREYYAIVLMGNFTYAFSENGMECCGMIVSGGRDCR